MDQWDRGHIICDSAAPRPAPAGPAGPPGLTWRGPWNANTNYAVNDAVSYNGSSYIAVAANSNAEPDTNTASWNILALEGAPGPTGPQGPPGSAAGLPTATAPGQFIVSGTSQGYWNARALESSDIPDNAANTTGNAANVTGTVAIEHGGTGETTAAAALTALGAVPAAGGAMTGNLTVPTVNATGATSINATGVVNAGSVSASGAVYSGSLTTGTATINGNMTHGGSDTLNPTGTATSSNNYGSMSEVFAGSYWNGSAAASDTWTVANALGSGANPTSTLSITHSGSTGSATVSVPKLYSPEVDSTTVNTTTVNTGTVNASGAVAAASYSASGDISTSTVHTGTANVSGTLTANKIVLQGPGPTNIGFYPNNSGNDFSVQGTYLSWNYSNGLGETNYINVKPSIAAGGFYWHNINDGSTPSSPLMTLSSNGTLSATTKNFSIPYPGDPTKTLVHSSLEGPEIAVFYRGQATLANGIATITLPAYFEALTQPTGRTVLLTPIFTTAGEAISQLAASAVSNGQFQVIATDTNNPEQDFFWEVKAVRADQPNLEVVIDNPTTPQGS